jgi:CheY-like chemotaxis protein
MLQRLGHHVRQAESGRAAIDIVRHGGCDLVLMDMAMPGMDGLDATRAIRALPGLAGACPVVGLTANAAPEDRAACRAAGMDGFISKPVTRSKLAEAVGLAGRLSPFRERIRAAEPVRTGFADAAGAPHSCAMRPGPLVSTADAD